jgi:hypothetical protein
MACSEILEAPETESLLVMSDASREKAYEAIRQFKEKVGVRDGKFEFPTELAIRKAIHLRQWLEQLAFSDYSVSADGKGGIEIVARVHEMGVAWSIDAAGRYSEPLPR